jgi:hypothetical protein
MVKSAGVINASFAIASKLSQSTVLGTSPCRQADNCESARLLFMGKSLHLSRRRVLRFADLLRGQKHGLDHVKMPS